ncbi:hypothetical protein M3Y97_00734100 [Aphelenchoides bicaudatus]|nr:hypothetical protein M3Y97_00734100 [Aphelenchoides bicaudatus]
MPDRVFMRKLAIVCSLIVYLLVISLVLAALLTEFWVEANVKRHGVDSDLNIVSSGLFSGIRQLDYGLGPRRQFFTIIDEIHNNTSFISKGSWIFIIFFIALGLLFTFIGLIVALLNTLIEEVSTVLGPEGLYIWSTLSFFSYMVSILLFSRQFTSTIVKNVLLPEQIEAGFNSAGLARFGVSFWLFSAGTLLLFVPCVLIFASSKHKIKREKVDTFDRTTLMY